MSVAACAVALVLLMDASLSISPEDWLKQRDGTAQALSNETVVQVVERMPGGLALTVIAFDHTTSVILPWRIVRNGEDVRNTAAQLRAVERILYGQTHIGNAINVALNEIEQAPCEPEDSVIDISTDGLNGPESITAARERAISMGVKINAIGVTDASRSVDQMYDFLNEHVRTPGGFALAINDWDQFTRAMQRKLTLEIASIRLGAQVLYD